MTRVAYIAISEDVNANHAGLTHSRGICRGLAQTGAEVYLFLRGEKESWQMVEGVTEVVLPRKGFWKPLIGKDAEVWERARKKVSECDVVHERYSVNPLSRWLIGNRPVFLEVNDPLTKTWSGIKKIIFFPLIQAKKKNVCGVITQTNTLARLLKDEFSVPIRVISNGADVESFSTISKSNLTVKSDPLTVIFVGSFREWHGVELIPPIARRVVREIPNVQFVLVGDGPLFEQVKYSLHTNGLENNVVLRGAVPFEEVKKELLRADVAIAPFSKEGNAALAKYGFWWCPVKLFEYLAAGKAIVASDFAEVRTILGDAGKITPPSDVEKMAGEIINLLAHPALRQKLGSAAKKRALLFSWKNLAKQVREFYAETGV